MAYIGPTWVKIANSQLCKWLKKDPKWLKVAENGKTGGNNLKWPKVPKIQITGKWPNMARIWAK